MEGGEAVDPVYTRRVGKDLIKVLKVLKSTLGTNIIFKSSISPLSLGYRQLNHILN